MQAILRTILHNQPLMLKTRDLGIFSSILSAVQIHKYTRPSPRKLFLNFWLFSIIFICTSWEFFLISLCLRKHLSWLNTSLKGKAKIPKYKDFVVSPIKITGENPWNLNGTQPSYRDCWQNTKLKGCSLSSLLPLPRLKN